MILVENIFEENIYSEFYYSESFQQIVYQYHNFACTGVQDQNIDTKITFWIENIEFSQNTFEYLQVYLDGLGVHIPGNCSI